MSDSLPDHFAPPIPLREKVANALRHNDCGPGPVTWGEYLADADALIALIDPNFEDVLAQRDRLRAENERLRLAPSRAVLRSVVDELRALGQEWREEYPDGRVCKAELNRIADRIDAELSGPSDEQERTA